MIAISQSNVSNASFLGGGGKYMPAFERWANLRYLVRKAIVESRLFVVSRAELKKPCLTFCRLVTQLCQPQT